MGASEADFAMHFPGLGPYLDASRRPWRNTPRPAPVAPSMTESAATTDPAILVDVWFDVRCPWCFLGKRRLERAVEMFAAAAPGIRVTVDHHSFQLAPGMPDRFDGDEADYMLRYEGVPLEQSRPSLQALRRMAAEEGVELRFDELRQVNTRPAHRVFQYGKRHGRGEELLDRLFTGYFSECRDLADPEVLAGLAAEVGLDRAAAREAAGRTAAEESEWDEAIDADDVRARMLGANGVPYALVNAKYAISGGQRAEVFAAALRTVAEREFGIESRPAG